MRKLTKHDRLVRVGKDGKLFQVDDGKKRIGIIEFTFDKKTVLNFYADWDFFTEEQKLIIKDKMPGLYSVKSKTEKYDYIAGKFKSE